MSCFLVKKKKPGKNPDVDTSFLPDKDREVTGKKTEGPFSAGRKVGTDRLASSL